MRELALFAGGGGGILGGRLLGWETVCAVESDPYCREVLLRRQRDGVLPMFPIWDDVRTFRGDNPGCSEVVKTLGKMDDLIVTAGFPCQPYSAAGKRKGESDDRNLWPDTIRILREMGSCFPFLENVPGLLRFDYFGEILGDLGDTGYDAEWDVISAAEVGAPHLRKRLWILPWEKSLAHPKCFGCDVFGIKSQNKMVEKRDFGIPMFERGMVQGESERLFRDVMGRIATSGIDREIDGVANRVDRLRAIGNGQVPLVAAVAFLRLAKRAGLIELQ